ncbi:MAG: mechanosensitive ion channel [Tannerellaceae bacterium]|nr:mechanosensitive ion channel [Tannerellaceae bacterium]
MCKLLLVFLQTLLFIPKDTTQVVHQVAHDEYSLSHLEKLASNFIDKGAYLGWLILKALLIFMIGRFLIGMVNKVIRKLLNRRSIDPSVNTFLTSLINVVLTVLLIISVIGALGVQTTSFAAVLASVGVAMGVALSGNLSNFAGGLLILLFKPFKVGDFIEAQSNSGTVKEIQIFHTIITTSDNRVVYIPNGALSSGVIMNVNLQANRRVEWIFGVEYGVDYEKVKTILLELLQSDARVLKDPAPSIALKELDSSSVNIMLRGWVNASDYWDVYFEVNKNVYERFNKEKVNFPFQQLVIHQYTPTTTDTAERL